MRKNSAQGGRLLYRLSRLTAILSLVSIATADWQSDAPGVAFAVSVCSDSSGNKLTLSLGWGGVWQSHDRGQSWEPINQRITFDSRLLTANEIYTRGAQGDTIVLMASADPTPPFSWVWMSTSGGLDWRHPCERVVSGNYGDVLRVARQDAELWLHAREGEFHSSRDQGQHWTTVQVDSPYYSQVTSFAQDPLNDSTLFTTSVWSYDSESDLAHGGILRSDDLGQSWRTILDMRPLGTDDLGWVDHVLRVSNGNLLAAANATQLWETGDVIISTDDGATWNHNYGGLPPRFQSHEFLEDLSAPGTVFVRGLSRYGVYRSLDFGETWYRCTNGLPENVCIVNDLYQNPYSQEILVTITGYGLHSTTNHGQSWQTIPLPPVGLVGRFGEVRDYVYLRDYGYRQWQLAPDAEEWRELLPPVALDTLVLFRPVLYTSGDTLVSALYKRPFANPLDRLQMAKSFDGGLTWQTGPFLDFLGDDYFHVVRTPEVTRFLTWDRYHIYWSEDLGENWTSISLPSQYVITDGVVHDATQIFCMANDTVNQESVVLRSVDRGLHWTNLEFPASNSWIHTSFLFEGDFFASSYVSPTATIMRWHDGNWETRGTLPHGDDRPFLIAVPGPQPLLFGLATFNNRAWLSTDMGYTWSNPLINPPYPSQSYGFLDLEFSPEQNKIWAISGVGACYIRPQDLGTTKPIAPIIAINHLTVSPNPANSQIMISYVVERTSPVSLTIFNTLGQTVKTIFDETKQPGKYSTTASIEDMSSGTYFLRLAMNEQTVDRKFIVLK